VRLHVAPASSERASEFSLSAGEYRMAPPLVTARLDSELA